jgi:hypothetical protein
MSGRPFILSGMKKLIIACIVAAPSAPLALDARSKSPVLIGEIGLHCPYEVVSSTIAPDTEIGLVDQVAGEVRAFALTQVVPAIPGLAFGEELRLEEGATLPGTVAVTTHPPMGEQGVTEQFWPDDLSDQDWAANMYRFDFDYELLLGRWTMQLQRDGVTYSYVEFDVVPPPEGMTLESLCSGEDLLS